MNLENVDKGKGYNTEQPCTEIMQNFGFLFRILHSRNWKIGFFNWHIFTSLKNIIAQVNDMKCLWVDTIS